MRNIMLFFYSVLLFCGTVFGEEVLKNETIRSIKPKHFQIDLPSDLVLDPYEFSRPREKRQYVQYSPYQPQPQYYPTQQPQQVQQVYYPQAPQVYPPQQYAPPQVVQYSRPQVLPPQPVAPGPQYPRYDLRPQPVLVPRVQQRVLNPVQRPPVYMTTPTPRLIITNAPRHIGYVTLVTPPPKYIAPVVATAAPRRIPAPSQPQPATVAPYIAPIATTLAPTTTVKYVAPTTRYVAPTTTTVRYVAPTVATTRYVAPTTTTRYVAPTTTTTTTRAPTTTTTTTTTTQAPPPTTTTVRYIETTSATTTVSIPPTLTLTSPSSPPTTPQWVQPKEPLPLEAYFPAEAVETPKFDESFVGQYYYGKRGQGNTTFPLPSCFYNPSGYVCCSLMLNELMTASFEETRKTKGSLCNVQRIANALQKHSEKIFNTQFETVVSYEDFSQKIHFKRDLVCKIEVEGRFILAYATPEQVEAQKIIPTVPSQNIVKDSAVLKEELRQRIQQSDRTVIAN